MSKSTIPVSEVKLLAMKSGGVCAFPGCGRRLYAQGTTQDEGTVLGEIAHVVGDSRQGPRGREDLDDEARNRHENLIYLCGDDHKRIDSQKRTFSVAVLRQMKADHEDRVARAMPGATIVAARKPTIEETVHSTLLAFSHLPDAVFAASCSAEHDDVVKQRVNWPKNEWELAPFVRHGGRLLAFHDLTEEGNPFERVIDMRNVETIRAKDMWREADGHRLYVRLLNRALYKYTGRLGVRFDPGHGRFYFAPEVAGQERRLQYQSLQGRKVTRNVVWQPKRKATKVPHDFWWHLAAGLRIHQMGAGRWCLSIRPERHLTTDSVTPLTPAKVGRRVSSLKARMYNDGYFAEVNFWRDLLSRGKERFVLNFGTQAAIVMGEFLATKIEWAGVPDDAKPYKHELELEDELFAASWLTGAEAIDWEDADDGEGTDTDRDVGEAG